MQNCTDSKEKLLSYQTWYRYVLVVDHIQIYDLDGRRD